MRRFLLALALLAPLASAGPARAEESLLDRIIGRGTLRVGLTGDYRPFSLRDAAGTTEGMDVDTAQAMAAALGVKLEIVPTSWPTLLPDLLAGKFDLAGGGITITTARAKQAYFSMPVQHSGKTPIVRCTDVDKYGTIAQIDQPSVRVIVNPGGTNESFDRANFHSAQIVMFPDNARIFDELVANHADVMVTDVIETRLQHKLHPELCPVHPDAPFNHSDLAWMMPRDVPLQQWVNVFLAQAAQSGEAARTEAKWLGN